jgi:hypothetical protein
MPPGGDTDGDRRPAHGHLGDIEIGI